MALAELFLTMFDEGNRGGQTGDVIMIALRWLLLLIAVTSPAWDWHALARTAEECGAEFKAADLDKDNVLDEAEIASAPTFPHLLADRTSVKLEEYVEACEEADFRSRKGPPSPAPRRS
jgi:hypothetical protein